MIGLFGQLDERAVRQRIAPDDPRLVAKVVVFTVQRDLDLVGAFDDVVVGEDQAFFPDDEAGAGRDGRRHVAIAFPVAARLPEEPAEQVVAAAEELGEILLALVRFRADVDDGRVTPPWQSSGTSARPPAP